MKDAWQWQRQIYATYIIYIGIVSIHSRIPKTEEKWEWAFSIVIVCALESVCVCNVYISTVAIKPLVKKRVWNSSIQQILHDDKQTFICYTTNNIYITRSLHRQWKLRRNWRWIGMGNRKEMKCAAHQWHPLTLINKEENNFPASLQKCMTFYLSTHIRPLCLCLCVCGAAVGLF